MSTLRTPISSFHGRDLERVTLVFPPVSSVAHYEPMVTTPMGLAYLGASLRRRGFAVTGIDALAAAPFQTAPLEGAVVRYGLTVDEIVARVVADGPDVVGISCLYSNQWPVVRELARALHRALPTVLVATGGTHPSFAPARCLDDSEVDLIVIGEGERTFPEALERIAQGRGLDDLPGVAWRDERGARDTGFSPLVEDLDQLPFPAHDLFPPERYFEVALPMGYTMRSRRALPIITSRGCPCRCTFCASTVFWRQRFRTRSADDVLAEIDWLRAAYGIEELKFQDDNLTANRARAKNLFGALAVRSPKLHWNTPNGLALWTLDDEMLALMKAAGCFEITMSVESGNQRVLDEVLHKPLELRQAEEVSRLARRHGIFRVGYFIIGFPGETRAEIEDTVRFSRKLDLDWSTIFIYSPLPGSPLYEDCLRRGLLPSGGAEAGNVYFAASLSSAEWTATDLEAIIRREHMRNYLSVLKNPTVVLPSHLAISRNRPGVYRFMLSRSARTLRLALGRKGS